MNTPPMATSANEGGIAANMGYATTQLITLPAELLLEIVKHCADIGPNLKLSDLSLVARCLRPMCIPYLFRTMQLSTRESLLQGQLRNIAGKRDILNCVRVLNLYTEGPVGSSYTPAFFPNNSSICEPETAGRFVEFLLSLPNLEDVRLDMRFQGKTMVAPLRREIHWHSMTLPLVKALNIPVVTMISIIPDIFPNLRALSLNIKSSPYRTPYLLEVAQKLQLDYLEVYKLNWRMSDIQELDGLFGSVSHLTIGGDLGASRNNPWGLTAVMRTFRNFHNLRVLALTDQRWTEKRSIQVRGFNRACDMRSSLLPANAFHPERGRRLDIAWYYFFHYPKLEVIYLMDRMYVAHCCVPVRDLDRLVDVRVAESDEEICWPEV